MVQSLQETAAAATVRAAAADASVASYHAEFAKFERLTAEATRKAVRRP